MQQLQDSHNIVPVIHTKTYQGQEDNSINPMMESDTSNNYAPRGVSPSAVAIHQSATVQQSQPPEVALEKTPTTDTSTVVSKPTSPVPEADRLQTAADVAILDQDK